MNSPSAPTRSVKERLRSFLANLDKWAIAMDDVSPTNAIFDRLHALETRVEQLEAAHSRPTN